MGRRKQKTGWGLRAAALALLILLAGAAYLWWSLQHWTPEESAFPDQGALISASDGLVNFNTLAAIGASFAYLEASDGAGRLDPRFARNFSAAREAGRPMPALSARLSVVPADSASSPSTLSGSPDELEAQVERMKAETQDLMLLLSSDYHAPDFVGRRLRRIYAGCPVAPDEGGEGEG